MNLVYLSRKSIPQLVCFSRLSNWSWNTKQKQPGSAADDWLQTVDEWMDPWPWMMHDMTSYTTAHHQSTSLQVKKHLYNVSWLHTLKAYPHTPARAAAASWRTPCTGRCRHSPCCYGRVDRRSPPPHTHHYYHHRTQTHTSKGRPGSLPAGYRTNGPDCYRWAAYIPKARFPSCSSCCPVCSPRFSAAAPSGTKSTINARCCCRHPDTPAARLLDRPAVCLKQH